MNLALVISSLDAGGAERVMSQLAGAWAARGDTVTLVTLAGLESDRYALDARVKRVALGLRGDSGSAARAIAANYRRLRALRAAIAASGAPVVLSFEDRANVLLILATIGMGVRRVIAERTDPRSHPIGAVWNALRRLTYRFADALVVQTAALAPWGRDVTRGRPVAVIPNPVRDLPCCKETPRADTIVAVGRLAPQKGYDVLLEAFARFAREAPGWRLVIVGEGGESGRLVRLSGELGIAERVTLRGWLAEPAEVLCHAGVFVLSSPYEGFPNALLEAMACGVPVVSSAWAGSDQIITHERDGLLVPVGDVAALAAALSRLALDAELRARLGREALRVRERFSLPAVLAEWDRVLASAPRRD